MQKRKISNKMKIYVLKSKLFCEMALIYNDRWRLMLDPEIYKTKVLKFFKILYFLKKGVLKREEGSL